MIVILRPEVKVYTHVSRPCHDVFACMGMTHLMRVRVVLMLRLVQLMIDSRHITPMLSGQSAVQSSAKETCAK